RALLFAIRSADAGTFGVPMSGTSASDPALASGGEEQEANHAKIRIVRRRDHACGRIDECWDRRLGIQVFARPPDAGAGIGPRISRRLRLCAGTHDAEVRKRARPSGRLGLGTGPQEHDRNGSAALTTGESPAAGSRPGFLVNAVG